MNDERQRFSFITFFITFMAQHAVFHESLFQYQKGNY